MQRALFHVYKIFGVLRVVTICWLLFLSLRTFPAERNQPPSATTHDTGIHKIKHVIIIMQENRSFDSYFGTFPGLMESP